MKILIVEDDLNKMKQLSEYIGATIDDAELVLKKSYQAGLKVALRERPEIVILDMSMPNYELSPSEPGGRFRYFAGRDILKEIKRKGVDSKVIVVTMYESFGEGEETLKLDELKKEMEDEFSVNYVGTVFYEPAASGWRDELGRAIARACEAI